LVDALVMVQPDADQVLRLGFEPVYDNGHELNIPATVAGTNRQGPVFQSNDQGVRVTCLALSRNNIVVAKATVWATGLHPWYDDYEPVALETDCTNTPLAAWGSHWIGYADSRMPLGVLHRVSPSHAVFTATSGGSIVFQGMGHNRVYTADCQFFPSSLTDPQVP
jgi:hypothetical protein